MLKVLNKIGLLCCILLLAACGEFLSPSDWIEIEKVTMSRHAADLLVGDTLILDAHLSPEVTTASLQWYVDQKENNAVSLIGRRVYGKERGYARVRVEASNAGSAQSDSVAPVTHSDTCFVRVFDWGIPPDYSFPYETIVVATLKIDNVDITENLGDWSVVATVDGKIRGVAVTRNAHHLSYLTFRIGSDVYGENACLEAYNKKLYRHIHLAEVILDGETHGTLSNPWHLQADIPQ